MMNIASTDDATQLHRQEALDAADLVAGLHEVATRIWVWLSRRRSRSRNCGKG